MYFSPFPIIIIGAFGDLINFDYICRMAKVILSDAELDRLFEDVKNNPSIRRRHNTNSLRKYGINIKEYEELLKKQDYRCAICNKHQLKLSRTLGVDHNHETGQVRGLLCYKCNTGIGMLNDSIDIVQNALNYLKIHK